MLQKTPTLKAFPRDKTGSRYCQRIRAKGQLPAVVYGHKQNPEAIVLDFKEAVSHINKGEKVFRLGFEGKGEGQVVLLKDLQFDYLGTNIVHADFARVDLNERVRTRVSVHLIGEAKGLKTAGAILMHPTNEVVIECVVTEIPEFIELNIADLDVDQQITVAQAKLPGANMKMITDPHSILAQIVIQQEIVVGEATAAEAGAAEPEVLTAKKPAEGEAGAAAAGAKGAAPAAKGAAPAAKGAAPAKDAKPAAGAAPKK
ncbi:MAG: 50S ribosomal protein L25 [Phycisphaerales bacterium]|nr:50S ribosomal protein L25 [Planctomycetota bacterium]